MTGEWLYWIEEATLCEMMNIGSVVRVSGHTEVNEESPVLGE